ncbi:MAG: hypothetical protein OEM15_07030 [Myxococcales bacterium]|nr:hypothetical protein [Myxococcales bacterium]MDH3483296.1 hypothetical protein [Myxococcales bacterium]
MRALVVVILLGSMSGCTLLNAPDRKLQPPDGGVDGGAGIELFCDDGLDDDEDSFFDCEDADCAEEPACCERRSPTLDEDWTAADLRLTWVFGPTTGNPWLPARPTFEGATFVGNFESNDEPRALISSDCVSLALGGWVNTTLRSTDETGCTNGAPCDRYAGVVLSVATDLTPGSKLQDELAVTLHAGGLVLVTQADVEVARTTTGIDQNTDVEIIVRPTLNDEAQPILRATVTVGSDVVLEGFLMSRIQDLVATGECEQIPGLHVAAQSQGDGVYVGPLTTAKQDCANPGQFEKQVATLTGESLQFAPSWGSAYVGSPALASSRNAVSDVQWDLIVEGSNDSPELEPVAHVGYAIGHARDTTDEGDDWSLDGWTTSGGPKAGDDPPSCVGVPGGCDENVSVREPHLLAELNEDQALRDLVLSFAREVPPNAPDIFGIQILRPVGGPMTPAAVPATPTLSPDDVPECTSLRDPSLIPVDPEAQQGYWLFFTCVQGAGAATEIHAVRISRALEVVLEGGGPLRRIVLTADELGPFAAAGIRSAEPLISFAEDGLRLRIWFLAQSTPGEWGIALAEARSHDVGMLAFELPEALPFPVNPILSSDSPLVRSDCLGEDCSITGIAVTRRADDQEVLRFLLARRVNLPGGGRTDQLIPLEQMWRMP